MSTFEELRKAQAEQIKASTIALIESLPKGERYVDGNTLANALDCSSATVALRVGYVWSADDVTFLSQSNPDFTGKAGEKAVSTRKPESGRGILYNWDDVQLVESLPSKARTVEGTTVSFQVRIPDDMVPAMKEALTKARDSVLKKGGFSDWSQSENSNFEQSTNPDGQTARRWKID